MSLETAMQAQTEALLKHADALNNYANVLNSIANANPNSIVVHNVAAPAGDGAAAASAPAAEGAKRGRKSAADKAAEAAAASSAGTGAAASDGGDDFGGEEADPFGESSAAPATPALTRDSITKLVIRVKDEKGKDTAIKLLKHLGVDTVAKIEEKDFQKVVDLAGKVGITL